MTCFDSFDFEAVPMMSKAHAMAICAGDSWIDPGVNLILIGGTAIGIQRLPVAVVFGLPHPAHALMGLLEHGQYPFIVALADDAQGAAGIVDGGDGESSGLADPLAAAAVQLETAAMGRIAHAGENAPHLGVRKGLRQPLLLGEPDLFLDCARSLPRVFR
jgi:hypothetical protein